MCKVTTELRQEIWVNDPYFTRVSLALFPKTLAQLGFSNHFTRLIKILEIFFNMLIAVHTDEHIQMSKVTTEFRKEIWVNDPCFT